MADRQPVAGDRRVRRAAPGRTAVTSVGSPGVTGTGWRHQASTGVTENPLRLMNNSGSTASTSTPDASTPASSAASRSAAGDRAAVRFLDRPAWKGGLARMPAQPRTRWTSSRSGPSGPSPKSISTADGRPPPGGGRKSGGTGIRGAAAARSRSQPAARHRLRTPMPESSQKPRHENGPALTRARAVFSSVGPFPVGRAEPGQRAGSAGGLARVAHPSAMPDHPVGKRGPLRPRNQGADFLLDLHRISGSSSRSAGTACRNACRP